MKKSMLIKPIKLQKDLSDIVINTINGYVEENEMGWGFAMQIIGDLNKKICDYIAKPKFKYRMRCVCKWKGDLDGTIKHTQFNLLSPKSDCIRRYIKGNDYWDCETFVIFDNETNELVCNGKDYNDFVRWCKENGK